MRQSERERRTLPLRLFLQKNNGHRPPTVQLTQIHPFFPNFPSFCVPLLLSLPLLHSTLTFFFSSTPSSTSTSFSLQFDEASSSDAQPVDPNASYSFAHDFRPTAIASDSDSDDSDSGARGMALY